MKKKLIINLIFLFIIFLSLSFVSAFSFNDYLNKITGKATSSICQDTDGGLNYYVPGQVSQEGIGHRDICNGQKLTEWYCNQGFMSFVTYTCPAPSICYNKIIGKSGWGSSSYIYNSSCCTPNCAGKTCGADNGCGGKCSSGTCPTGQKCDNNKCVCIDTCASKKYNCGTYDFCGVSTNCGPVSKTCTSKFGICSVTGTQICNNGNYEICIVTNPRITNCKNSDGTDKQCGDDGCGGSCGTCETGTGCKQDLDGKFICKSICTDSDNGGDGQEFIKGTVTDIDEIKSEDSCEIDSILTEMICDNGVTSKSIECKWGCENGACKTCVPDCTNKQCGDDGCGGICGTCETGKICDSGICKCADTCATKEYNCGTEIFCGVTSDCGTCEEGKICYSVYDIGRGGTCQDPCIDSDGGEDIYIKSSATGWNPFIKSVKTENDNCQSDTIVNEAVCNEYGPAAKQITCPINNNCVDGVCVCTPNCEGKTCGDDGCGGSCGACGVGEECIEGICEEILNQKNMDLYPNKNVFLVSNEDWHDILPLVSTTTWTSSNPEELSWCKKGYGTADDVCIYPFLIYTLYYRPYYKIDSADFSIRGYDEINDPLGMVYEGMVYEGKIKINVNFDKELVLYGEELNANFEIVGNDPISPVNISSIKIEKYPSDFLTLFSNPSVDVDRSLNFGESVSLSFKFKNTASINSDINSIIYFMQQYSTKKVTVIGEISQEVGNLLIAEPSLGVGLQEENIQRINPNDYLSYWQYYNNLVYVEDNYELALLASTYASLLNAPLIIQRTELDQDINFENKKIICVGNVNRNCNEQYDLEQLQNKYFEKTNTDKVILINPLEKENGLSLASPFLASAKKELIVSTFETDFQSIADFIHNKISEINAKYLTIIASLIIPYNGGGEILPGGGTTAVYATDPLYADINSDKLPDVAVGRIIGMTISDVSSYIARDLFYNEIIKTKNIKILVSTDTDTQTASAVEDNTQVFNDAGYNALNVISTAAVTYFSPYEWNNQNLIYYLDHGSRYWAGIYYNEIPLLDSSLVLADACSTCDLDESIDSRTKTFCLNAIKQGAIGYLGAVTVATTYSSPIFIDFLNNIYYDDLLLGDAFSKSYKTTAYFTEILLGDPTIKIYTPYKLKEKLINIRGMIL